MIAGGSASAVFPTGSGKSLLYQIPALAFDQLDEEAKAMPPGVTLVISPLIALMKVWFSVFTGTYSLKMLIPPVGPNRGSCSERDKSRVYYFNDGRRSHESNLQSSRES